MPNLNDRQCIEAARQGDHHAFKQLVEQYERFVVSIAYRFTQSTMEAEDLAQECFVRFWKNLERFNPDHPLKPWLGKIITNMCLDHLKSARKKMELNSFAIEDGIEIKDHRQHENELHASELQQAILKLAELLTPKQKAAFILRDLEMMEVQEVCAILNETAENIKSNLYYARKSIRENLLKHYKTSLL